ncbi:Gfo/Idh/MocA family protein [Lysobacter arvi]|uniref:Gfo/Idh/MocA family oxidoreductase n=1 Tax=Lysobacter arvi TaxID=3038776 RepID=A0ABU1CBR2_9GAMM|nr:Gfo/Idh/MocA family oxidoreductase [Lysobacter arvi]MDR0182623.1 Gfo/Idh/MocA family oxidoreductase [Lysobacter arvi]
MNARLRPSMRTPRLGFLGLGWIGCQRMQVLVESGIASVSAIADSNGDCLARAAPHAPQARHCRDIDQLLAMDDLDGIVIATPSGAHATQAIRALDRGLAVFCQKPLTRTALEARQVVDAARRADRLLDVDFSYRQLHGVAELRERIQRGDFGDIHAIDLVFHNAYGPDKPWFYDLSQSGGGCVMDLGIHLVDLAQWMCGTVGHGELGAMLHAGGRPLPRPMRVVEDYACAQWRLDNNASVRMACSWRLHAGRDAVIEAAFYGTRGGGAIRNVGGSFYDFTVDAFDGTRSTRVASPPDAWGGRTLIEWARRVGAGEGFDPQALALVDVASTVDAIYGR